MRDDERPVGLVGTLVATGALAAPVGGRDGDRGQQGDDAGCDDRGWGNAVRAHASNQPVTRGPYVNRT